MNKSVVILVVALIVVGLVVFMGPFYILQEGEQAVVIRFGAIVNIETEAGLKFKVPVLDTVMKYSKRILSWDGSVIEIPTSENNQFILVDTTARWQIVDPTLFYKNLTTMSVAYDRMSTLINTAVKSVITNNPLREAVRNSDYIMQATETTATEATEAIPAPAPAPETEEIVEAITGSGDIALQEEDISFFINPQVDLEEESTQSYESIIKGRKVLSDEILDIARRSIGNFGIDLRDVVIRQIRYSDDLTPIVYNRMIAERRKVAERYRAAGEAQKSALLGLVDREQRRYLSDAYRIAEEIKGEADAEATRIYADAAAQDSGFFIFWRAIESYRKTLPDLSKILSTDMEYFQFLYNSFGL